jgi:hypothetical protein
MIAINILLEFLFFYLRFICDNYNRILNSRDNLNRTSLHYACIMNDKTSIEILEQANAKQVKLFLI